MPPNPIALIKAGLGAVAPTTELIQTATDKSAKALRQDERADRERLQRGDLGMSQGEMNAAAARALRARSAQTAALKSQLDREAMASGAGQVGGTRDARIALATGEAANAAATQNELQRQSTARALQEKAAILAKLQAAAARRNERATRVAGQYADVAGNALDAFAPGGGLKDAAVQQLGDDATASANKTITK